MIVFNLGCDKDHHFEGWFASAAAFEAQCARGLVSCPTCGSTRIARLPSAPYVQTRHSAAAPVQAAATPPANPAMTPEAATVMALLRSLAREAEYVGARFPEEARRIHHGETEARSIRGQADRDALEELLDEGIAILPLPPGDDELH